MKRILIPMSLVLCLSTMVTFAADPLGAPKAELAQGKFGLALEYSYAEMNLMRRVLGYSADYSIDSMNTEYLTASYGVLDQFEVFARVGAVTPDGSTPWSIFGSSRFDDDYDTNFIYGAGAKVTLGCAGPVTFGAVGTYSYFDNNGDCNVNGSFDGKVKMRMQQIQVAVGGTWNATESVSVYGGALMHYIRAKISRDLPFVGSVSYIAKNDDGGSMFGGYVGTKIGLTENLSLSVEGSYTADSKGGSAMLGWAF